MKIYYYNGTLWKDVTTLDSSFCEETIDRFSRISLDFVLPSEELVPELCHVTWRGEEYTLYTVPKVVKVSTREYRYTLILEGRYKELERTLVKDKLGRTKFVFTGRADQYADLISGCIDGWSAGTCTTGDRTQVIAFSNNSLLDACRMVASKFETEVQLDGGKIAFGRVEKHKGDPLTLAYRQGLQKEITTEPDSKETALGRLHVMGGSHNIDPAKYGSHTLHLPKGGSLSVEGHTFRVDAEGRYISLDGDTRLNTSERALDATTIYPKRVGTISKVEQKGDEWDVIDKTNPVDYTQHRVGGDVMRLEFQSGRLAGRSFDLTTKDDKLTGYVHAEKRFRLVRREIDGVLMPEPGTFFPSVWDKYAIFGCSLPDEYVASAEAEMLSIGARYMAERLEARVQYRAELDGLWAKKNWSAVAHKLTIGTIVRLEGTAKDVRISSVRTSLNSPYTPRITFSNAPYMVGSLTTQIATIESAEVRTREETRQSLLSLQARTYEDTKVVREMIERLRVEGFTQAIKPETLQSMYAVIGSPALQFDFVRGGGSVPFSWSEGKGGTITIPGQSIRRKASGTTLEPGDKSTVTDIPALTYTLKAEERQAYVYTELSPAPHFVISTKPLAISPDRLLVGLLNGEEGKRAFTPLYGFTEITPGQLKTDLIRSQDGKSYWDLLTGKFATTGDLLIGDPKGDTCLAYIDGVLYVKGLTVSVGSSSTTIEDALLEQDRKLKEAEEARAKAEAEQKREIENAKKVRQPIIKNGTWWVWDDTTNQLIDSGKPAQGATGATGEKGEQGAPGKDGAPVRDNLFTAKLYTFAQNDRYGAKCTHLGDGRWRVEKVAKSDRTYFDGASFFVDPIRDTKSGRYTISFRVVETRRPIKYQNTTAVSKKGSTITGDRYISTDNSNNGRLPGFSFYWGETPTNGNEIGDYTIIDQVKIERVAEGEDPMPTAYLPHPLDLKGEPGKDVDPKVLNDLKTAVDDARRKLDDTATKAELDGVVSAQEKKDIQAAKAALDAAKKAYDDAVKRAKELDGEIQVGGRNLAINSARKGRLTAGIRVIVLSEQFTKDTYYTLSFDVEVFSPPEDKKFLVYFGYNTYLFANGLVDYKEGQTRYSITLKTPNKDGEDHENLNTAYLYPHGWGNGYATKTDVAFSRIKLERGSVPTDWTPAPEDVQSEIDAAKEQATKAQTSTDNLKGYIDGAYKDGIITEVESKAIATYINEVEAMWSSAFGAYERVYTNKLLTGTPKTALGDAKITLAGAKDNLIGQIKQAISDGKATKAEATETERLYNVYKGALRDYQRALKVAEEAIRDAGKTTGGRNLVIRAGELRGKIVALNGSVQSYSNNSLSIHDISVTPGESLTFSKTTVSNTDNYWRYVYKDKDGELVDRFAKSPNQYTETVPDGASLLTVSYPTDAVVKLERGTVATDWTPAPEDVQAEIERERAAREAAVREVATGLASTDTLVATLEKAQQDLAKGKLNKDDLPNVEYLISSLQDGSTSHKGGLLLTNDIILSDPKSKEVTAMISGNGVAGTKSIRLGIHNSGGVMGEETTALANDGTGHIGELYFGGREIGFGAADKRYMQIGGTAPAEYDMVNASNRLDKTEVNGKTVTSTGSEYLHTAYVSVPGKEIKYTATLRVIAEAFSVEERNNYGGRTGIYRSSFSDCETWLRLTLSRGGDTVKEVTSPVLAVSVTSRSGRVNPGGQWQDSDFIANDSKEQAVTLSIPASEVRRGDSISLCLETTIQGTSGGTIQGANGGTIGRRASHAVASASDIVCYSYRDGSQSMVSVTKDMAAFFYGSAKYVLLNYLQSCVMKVVGNMIIQGNLTVKGDLKTEGGGFLAGGVISTSGSMYRWVGKKLKVSKRSTGKYRITHNIGHTNYCIQAIPINDTDWNAFVISGTETTYDVEIGVQWNGGWRDGAIHFAIFAQ